MTAKVLFVIPSFAGGGAERVMIGLANGVDRSAYSPVLLTLTDSGPLRENVLSDVEIVSLGCPRIRSAFNPMRRAIKGLRPDVVASTMGYLNIGVLAACMGLRPKPKIVVREANSPAVTFQAGPTPWLMRCLYRFFYPTADMIVAPSAQIAEELGSITNADDDVIRLLFNPVDQDKSRKAAEPVVRVLGAGARFVCAGRLTHQKGFDMLLDMFADVAPDTHLTVLGDGEERSALSDQAARLGLSERVSFAGFVSNPWRYYAGADAFLLPSRWEGMPNAALEALACGVPVIGTPTAGGLSEVAGLARAGSVTIAEIGPSFATAMKNVSVRSDSILLESRLPDAFRKEAVIEKFQEELAQLLDGSSRSAASC